VTRPNPTPFRPLGRTPIEQLEPRDVPAGSGLTATYYDDIEFTGPTVTRVDPVVDFRWGNQSPAPGIGPNTFSVRWTGQVEPAFSERYTFHTLSDEGVRLRVNGQLLIDNWVPHRATENKGAIVLQAGQRVEIVLEYYERTGKAVASLLWSSPSQPKQVIPTARLYPAAADPRPAPPTGLTAEPLSDTAVRLAWTDNATTETGYVVERSEHGLVFATVAELGANAVGFVHTGLQPMSLGYYRVRAVNAAGASDPSVTLAVRTLPRVVQVGTTAAFRSAVQSATPGTRIELLPGVYGGDNFFGDIRGEPGRPIVIAAANPADKPVFQGGGQAMQFADPAYLELRDLVVQGATANGINIDDWGTFDTPAHHIVLSGLTVRDIGPTGNRDGIKLSGVRDFRVENCTILRWGDGGSGIDMVGCHNGLITGSLFAHTDNIGGNGVQAKGGSTWIVVRGNRFEHAGARAVQIGGSTGLQFFRPQPPAGYEAKDVTVERNVFIGARAAVAFVNVDGSVFRFNTVYRPSWYAIRILQETTAPGFVPSRNGVITDNIFAFRSDEMAGAVNVGPSTAPATFQFARNWWYCINNPSQSTPALPAPEVGGTYGIDPQFVDAANGDLHTLPGSPASGVGAYAVP
jgi:hypothetical protein